MKKLKRYLFFSLLIFIVLLLSACGSSGSVKSSPKYQTLTVEKIGEGAVIPVVGSHEMEKETIANLKATAASGWQFVNWEGEVANTASAETTVYMDGDKTVKAVFEELEPNLEYQTLTVEKIGEGAVIPAVGSHEMEKETTANLKATAASGWQFVNWEGEVANTASAETTVY
ncbi:InlB B-repeat-containing protein, partial [Halanaerobacter jeridensis]